MGQILNSATFRLFRKSNKNPLLEGVGSVLDFSSSNKFYNYNQSDKEADLESLKADWVQVGADLNTVMDEYAATLK